eukprot:1887953-Pyramimonas_sp.AAC.1
MAIGDMKLFRTARTANPGQSRAAGAPRTLHRSPCQVRLSGPKGERKGKAAFKADQGPNVRRAQRRSSRRGTLPRVMPPGGGTR